PAPQTTAIPRNNERFRMRASAERESMGGPSAGTICATPLPNSRPPRGADRRGSEARSLVGSVWNAPVRPGDSLPTCRRQAGWCYLPAARGAGGPEARGTGRSGDMETSRLGAPDEPGGPGRTGTTEQYDGPRVTTPTATTDHADANRTAFTILGAISVCHMLNDMLQSLLPAIYPMLKSDFGLDFVQVGLITLTFQLTASLLQPVVGLYTDRRPMPYSLAMGMASTLAGLLLLSVARSFSSLLLAAALVGMGSSVFHPESSRVARMASGGRHGLAQSFFQVGGNVGTAIGPLMAAFIVLPHGQRSIGGFSLIALLAILILWRIGNWYARH